MFKIDDKNDTFKAPDRDEYKRYKQKEHNNRQKRFAKTIGENFAAYSLVAIMMLMIASIWSEVSIFLNWQKFIGDALVTIVLYILADVCASYIGTQGGRLDDDYIKNHEEYLSLRTKVREAGTVLLNIFCDWQIDVEYEFYIRKRCKDFKIDYKEYMANYHGKSFEELQAMFPPESLKGQDTKNKFFGVIKGAKTTSKATKVFQLNQIEPIELTPDILMTDGMVRNKRGNVGISGEEYVEKHTVGKGHIALTAIIAIIAAIPVFTLAREFTIGAIIYTVFKIALLLFRMYSGYSRGSKAFCSVEPKHLQDKIKYLYLYLEFLDKKIYKELEDRYTVTGDDDDQAGWKAQVDEGGAGGHS